MTRALKIGGMVLLAAIPLLAEQKGGARPPKAPPASRGATSKPGNSGPGNSGLGNSGPGSPKPEAASPNAGARAGGGRLPHPLGNPVQRMMAMSPEQRVGAVGKSEVVKMINAHV